MLDKEKNGTSEEIREGINAFNEIIEEDGGERNLHGRILSAINQMISYDTSYNDSDSYSVASEDASNLFEITNLISKVVSKLSNKTQKHKIGLMLTKKVTKL